MAKRQRLGIITREQIKAMSIDYVTKKVSLEDISRINNISIQTLEKISEEYGWKDKRKDWDERKIVKATTKRMHSSKVMVGKMTDILERHCDNLVMLSNNVQPTFLIPKYVIDETFKMMTYIDKTLLNLAKADSIDTPAAIEVIAPGLDYKLLEAKVISNNAETNVQLQEWEASRNPNIKEDKKDDSNVFDVASKEVKPTANSVEDQEEDDFIGGIFE